jgi:SAM-dependent methyltransferase
MFISPEYFKFLCDCALRPSVVIRDDPSSDRQIQAVLDVLDLPEPRTILDFGAGNGGVLQGLIDVGETSGLTTYIALDPNPSGQLDERLRQARTSDRISVASRRISTLAEAPTEVDAIVLLNTCHEILLPDLAIVLAQLLGRYMRQDRLGRLIIHEMTELRLGEDAFVMWTSDDYDAVFGRIDGLRVIRVPDQSGRGVPLATTIICRDRPGSLPDDLEPRVRANFYAQLSIKKSAYLRELAELRGSRRSVARQEMLRQRRVASLTAQIATICLIESAVA